MKTTKVKNGCFYIIPTISFTTFVEGKIIVIFWFFRWSYGIHIKLPKKKAYKSMKLFIKRKTNNTVIFEWIDFNGTITWPDKGFVTSANGNNTSCPTLETDGWKVVVPQPTNTKNTII